MSCCGQKRQEWRTPSLRLSPTTHVAPPVLQNPVPLAFLGEASIVVKGARTGLSYLFGPRGEALAVDERDASTLIATGHFART